MKCSLETWKWQQEIRKLESEQADEEENVFKIANEFIIKEVPDLKFKKTVYSEGYLKLCEIKKENFDVDNDKESSTPIADKKNEDDPLGDLIIVDDHQALVNDFVQPQTDQYRSNLYQRRSDLLKNNKENETHHPTESAYLKRVEQIISGNKMNKLHKQEAASQQAPIPDDSQNHIGSSSSNADLYKCKESDNFVLNSLSGLINKLADETKIDSLNEESTAMQFEAFQRSIVPEKRLSSGQMKSSPEPKIVKENDTNTIKTRSLIDEIMSSEGYVASPSLGLASMAKPTSQLIQSTIPTFVQPSNETGDLSSICSSGLKEFSVNSLQTKESDLFNLTNQHLNNLNGDVFAPGYDLPLPTDQRDAPLSFRPAKTDELMDVCARERGYIMSKSDDGQTEFKLHFVDKDEVTYYEYEPYLNGSPIASIDPRIHKIFPKSDSSGHSAPLPLSEYLSRSHLLNSSGDGLTLLSTLSDLREKKLI